MNWLKSLWDWCKSGTLSAWESTDAELTKLTRPEGSELPRNTGVNETFKGLKYEIPLPNPKPRKLKKKSKGVLRGKNKMGRRSRN